MWYNLYTVLLDQFAVILQGSRSALQALRLSGTLDAVEGFLFPHGQFSAFAAVSITQQGFFLSSRHRFGLWQYALDALCKPGLLQQAQGCICALENPYAAARRVDFAPNTALAAAVVDSDYPAAITQLQESGFLNCASARKDFEDFCCEGLGLLLHDRLRCLLGVSIIGPARARVNTFLQTVVTLLHHNLPPRPPALAPA